MNNDCLYFRLTNPFNKTDFAAPQDFFIRIVRPHSFSFHDIMWNIFSFGKYREYQLVQKLDGRIVSTAQVMPKIFIFQFMQKNKTLHIGPCATVKEFRGRGFYPLLLTTIMNDFKDKINLFYIFCDKTNVSSKRGIEKAGFNAFGEGYKNRFGIYVLDKVYRNKSC